MVFRSHRPIFGRIDHGTLSRIHSSDLSRSEEWDAQKGPNQREISMKPNALRWHFDRYSLHLGRHGVQRFLARPSLSISLSHQHDAMINGIFVQRNERQWRGQRKAVEDYLNGCRGKLVGEFTEVESGKRAVAGTCMDNRSSGISLGDALRLPKRPVARRGSAGSRNRRARSRHSRRPASAYHPLYRTPCRNRYWLPRPFGRL